MVRMLLRHIFFSVCVGTKLKKRIFQEYKKEEIKASSDETKSHLMSLHDSTKEKE